MSGKTLLVDASTLLSNAAFQALYRRFFNLWGGSLCHNALDISPVIYWKTIWSANSGECFKVLKLTSRLFSV